MSQQYFGSCLCGLVKFEVNGRFESFFLCHCEHCQKDSGSAHAANLFSDHAKLTFACGESEVKTFVLPGTRHTKSFCSHCGSSVPYRQQKENSLVVPAGSLDTHLEADLIPDAHIFCSSRAAWDHDLEQISKFEKFPNV